MQSKKGALLRYDDDQAQGPVRMQPPAHPLSPLWLSLSGQAVLVRAVAADLDSLSHYSILFSLLSPYGQFLQFLLQMLGPPGERASWRALADRKRSETMHLFHHPLSTRTGRYAGPRSVRSVVLLLFLLSLSRSLALSLVALDPYFRWR